MARHNKKKKIVETIDDKVVRWEEMEDIRKNLKLSHNEIFCGYLRQPIKYNPPYICGTCCLYNKPCVKIPEKDYDSTNCKKYNQYFKNET